MSGSGFQASSVIHHPESAVLRKVVVGAICEENDHTFCLLRGGGERVGTMLVSW